MTFKPIFAPKDALNRAEMERVVRNTLNSIAAAVKVDYKVTTRTWSEDVEFTIEKPDEGTRIVKTTNKIYKLVEGGTRPHIIRPRKGGRLTWMGNAYRAKTTPGVIGSKSGGNNNTIVHAKVVHHPGTAARNFTKAIQEKWGKEMQIRMQSAINAAALKNQK